MQDFSMFVGGQCEVQTNLNQREGRRTFRGEIKSIRVTDTEVEIYFSWLADWSEKEHSWSMNKSSPEHLLFKFVAKGPSEIQVKEPNPDGMVMIDMFTWKQFALLYSKDYRGVPSLLDRAKVEERQKQRDELNARLNATASGSSHGDDI